MAHKNVKRTAIIELGGIKFGIFAIGLTPDPKDARSTRSSATFTTRARRSKSCAPGRSTWWWR